MKLDYTKCMGCHACVSKCPQTCISMKADELGFLYPVIDDKKCVNCGLCVKTCEKVKKIPDCSKTREIYAVKNRNIDIVKASSSGGVFSALSNYVLKNQGVIVGAVYDDAMNVKHVFAETFTQRDKMRGSKYTYSLCDINIFTQVEKTLKTGKLVMFVGTPYQVSALKIFLEKEYENLFLVDLLCHGICAPIIYSDFLKDIRKTNKEVIDINFRYHETDWHSPKTVVTYDNRKSKKTERVNSYFKMFVRDYCLRESCYTCSFASFDRVSDVTLGDFWGIENCHKEFDDVEGVSVCVINTMKGKSLFENAKNELDVLKCEEKDCTHKQLNGLPHKGRNQEFIDDYLKYGYTFVRKKYATPKLSIRVREKLYRVKFINKVRNILKKI